MIIIINSIACHNFNGQSSISDISKSHFFHCMSIASVVVDVDVAFGKVSDFFPSCRSVDRSVGRHWAVLKQYINYIIIFDCALAIVHLCIA